MLAKKWLQTYKKINTETQKDAVSIRNAPNFEPPKVHFRLSPKNNMAETGSYKQKPWLVGYATFSF